MLSSSTMAPTNRIQLGTAVGLEQTVLIELLHIHASGLKSRSNPSTTPFIAELALGEDGDTAAYSDAVEDLLHAALAQLSEFDRFSSHSLRKGISELLGIGTKSWQSQADRFDNAAIELEYRNGNSLRKTGRKRMPGRERYIWHECLERLAAQIVAIATDRGFVYQGRFRDRYPEREPQVIVKQTLSKPTNDELGWFKFLAGDELRLVFTDGLATAYRDGLIPRLVRLAVSVVDGGDTELQQLEALVLWALEQSNDDPLWDLIDIPHGVTRLQGLTDLLGLGAEHYSSFAERERRAVDHWYPNNEARRRKGVGHSSVLIIEALSKPLADLTVRGRVPL